MDDEYHRHIDTLVEADEAFQSEDYVWATSEESRRDALSLHLIGSIVHRHGGTVSVDTDTDALNIEVPDDKKLALAEALNRKVGMQLQ